MYSILHYQQTWSGPSVAFLLAFSVPVPLRWLFCLFSCTRWSICQPQRRRRRVNPRENVCIGTQNSNDLLRCWRTSHKLICFPISGTIRYTCRKLIGNRLPTSSILCVHCRWFFGIRLAFWVVGVAFRRWSLFLSKPCTEDRHSINRARWLSYRCDPAT
jgi:hypothetical protein